MNPIILIAPPQAGKAIMSKKIVAKYNIPHISTGDLLRAEVASGSEFGKELDAKMKQGLLVDDQTIIKLVIDRINQTDAANGYILDGFPRTLDQALAYEEALKAEEKELGYFFILEIPFALAVERAAGRIVCPTCGASYSTTLMETKPKTDGKCDSCGTSLIRRNDDTEEALTKRFASFDRDTKPIIEYYEKTGNLFHINSEEKESAFAKLEEILNGDK